MHEPLLLNVVDDGDSVPKDEKEEFGKTKKAAVILRLARPDTWWILLGGLVGITASVFQAYIPYQIGNIIQKITALGSASAFDSSYDEKDDRKITILLVYLGAAGALCAILAGVRGAIFTAITGRLNTRLREALFKKLMHVEMAFYDKTMTGDVMSRLSTDTSNFANLACLNVNVFLRGSAQVGTTIIFMTAINPRLSLLSLLLVPAMVVLTALHGRSLARRAKAVQNRLAEANAVAQEAVGAISTVKGFCIEESTFHAYASSLSACLKHQIIHSAVYGSYTCISSILPHAVTIITLWYGGIVLLHSGAINVGDLVVFLMYQQALTSAFQALGEAVASTSSALGAVDRVAHLLLISSSRSESREVQQLVVVPTHGNFSSHSPGGVNVTFRDVWFSYPSRPMRQVLKGLNLEVPAGSSFAVVGKSGSGKSTLVNLIQRHYVAQAGSVSIDGMDIRSIPASQLKRDIIAHVPQEPVLFARSVWRNIVLGMEREDGVSEDRLPTVRDVENAARRANVHDFIMQLPQGYETQCGERGLTLSGGQKQRIAIARALVRRPKLLILDEATSSLDTETEEEVRREMIHDGVHACTTLIIAHRLSTVRDSPNIVVLVGGKIVEKGSHQELLSKNKDGMYARLYAAQWGSCCIDGHD